MSPKSFYQKPFVLSLLIISLSTLLIFPAAAADASRSEDAIQFVYTSCKNTSHVDLCFSTLSPYASIIKKKSDKLAQISLSVTLSKANQTAADITNLLRQMNNGPSGYYNQATKALNRCQFSFSIILTQLKIANKLMNNSYDPSSYISKDTLSEVRTSLRTAYMFEAMCIVSKTDLNVAPVKKTNVVPGIIDVGRFILISSSLTKKLM